MIANMQAIYIGNRAGSFKDDKEKEIDFCTVALGNPDDAHSDQVMLCSTVKGFDTSKLNRFQQYTFIVDIPIVLKDKAKVKIIDIVPFGNDKKEK